MRPMDERVRLFVDTEKLDKLDETKAPEKQLESLAEVVDRPEGEQEVSILAGDRRVVLNEYLPKGFLFDGSDGAEFKCHAGQPDYWSGKAPEHAPRVEFPPEKLNTLEGRLSLLHEMGHGLLMGVREFEPKRYHAYLRSIAEEIIHSIQRSSLYQEAKSPDERQKVYIEEFKKAWQHRSEQKQKAGHAPLRYEDLTAAIRELAEWERGAWAEALRLRTRIAKEKGIDVLEGADTRTLFAHIKTVGLKSYEEAYKPLMQLGAKDDQITRRDWMDRIFDWLERKAAG